MKYSELTPEIFEEFLQSYMFETELTEAEKQAVREFMDDQTIQEDLPF